MLKIIKKIRLIHVITFIMMLVGSFLIGLTDLISNDWSFDFLGRPNFWLNIITTNVGALILIITVLLNKVDTYKEKNAEFASFQGKLRDYHKDPTKYSKPVFDLFSSEYNKDAKKEQYLINMQDKFEKLKPTAKDLEIYKSGCEEEKKENKYCQKLAYYEYITSDEYIEKNLKNMRFWYPAISSSLIFSGYKQNYQGRDYITVNKTFKIVRDFWKKFLLTFGLIVLVASFGFDKFNFSLTLLFQISIKIFIIASQVRFALSYADQYNEEVTLHDIQFRYEITTQHEVWKANKLKEKHKEVSQWQPTQQGQD